MNTNSMNADSKWTIVIEKDGDDFFGRLDTPHYLFTTAGGNIGEVTFNIRDLMADYLEHEGKDDAHFAGVEPGGIEFDFAYDLETFFAAHPALNISQMARMAGLSPSLVRQYASGRNAPAKHTQVMQEAVREIGRALSASQLA